MFKQCTLMGDSYASKSKKHEEEPGVDLFVCLVA